MSKFYEHNQRFELKKMIRWEVGILKVKTGILRSTLAIDWNLWPERQNEIYEVSKAPRAAATSKTTATDF